ncbi:serine palmitoyltransferase small subunit B isoform X1 [Suricata suricatta]|uniref:serine palmitoyltransferase small subunit B isoform X1 n=1 Tax=Suricata suricatta TaxID=37032 RepID=UPI00115527FD|nr:serine palmitoyltransferase small subunit B isoform X1 [Suricata suricatta]
MLCRLPPRPGALGSLLSLLPSFAPQSCAASAELRPLARVCRWMDAGQASPSRVNASLAPNSHLRPPVYLPAATTTTKGHAPLVVSGLPAQARGRTPPYPLLPIRAAARGFTAAAGGDSDALASSVALRAPASPASGKRPLQRGWSPEKC